MTIGGDNIRERDPRRFQHKIFTERMNLCGRELPNGLHYHPHSHTVAAYEKLVFIDLETTGANPLHDRITEIGIVEVGEGKTSHWSSLVNPEMPIPAFIQTLTGISNDMVATAPTFPQIARTLLERLEGSLFIAHNARFDYGFLRNAFKELGYGLRCDVLCTVKLSRKLFPAEAKHNLDALIARHGLHPSGRHRALADAEVLWQFWNTLQASIPAQTFADTLKVLLQRPSMPANLPHDSLDDIPDTPGVYLFYAENDSPLYVGKSIHLRQRVMSHFNADHRLYKDMRISHQIHRLEWRETAGEIGALLLEAQLIKDLQPVHNRVLRRQRELCAWQLRPAAQGHLQPVLTYASEQDFGGASNLYGLFGSRRKAEDMLRGLAESHQLCLAMLGLENRIKADKPCFAYQLRRCHGACVGHEPAAAHQARLEEALRKLTIKTWPYAGAIGLIEPGATGHKDIHVVHNWCYLGSVRTKRDANAMLKKAPRRPAFDADTYKILVKALERKTLQVIDLQLAPMSLAA
jgi:DNA polymerase III subunit epsilon